MYRQYENPWELEEELSVLKDELETAIANEFPDECVADIQMDIYELEERINFAWQDNEYECDNYDWDDEVWMEEYSYYPTVNITQFIGYDDESGVPVFESYQRIPEAW